MKKTFMAGILVASFAIAGTNVQAQSQEGNYESDVQSGINDTKPDLINEPKELNEVKDLTDKDLINDQKGIDVKDLTDNDMINDQKGIDMNDLTDKDLINDQKGIDTNDLINDPKGNE